MKSIMWFRQDLRLTDNPALLEAIRASGDSAKGGIVPVYILDDHNPGDWAEGGARRWWLHHALQSLDEALDGHLQIFQGDPKVLLPSLVESFGAQHISWNRCYEPWQIQRDAELKKQLKAQGYEVGSCNGSLLWEPWEVSKADGTPYRVFTPYYKKGCLQAVEPRFPEAKPKAIPLAKVKKRGEKLQALSLLPDIGWDEGFYPHWQPGEEGARASLQQFLREQLSNYSEGRDVPGVQATSRLSPHLHSGDISPNQVWYAAKQFAEGEGAALADDLEHFLRELGWREFSYYLLYHFPDLPSENFQKKFDRFSWQRDEKLIEAWQQGLTGIPIVDAGMRELWQTGFMHNRVRMVVASFLVKNLQQDWRVGEAWFWDCLVDADLASNAASWQWVAGSGADAAPYFRIFNPVSQGEKFDKQGDYVKRYCPELAQLPNKYLHRPWEAPEEVLMDAGLKLGEHYPEPLVDLKVSRQAALDQFSALSSDK